MRYRNQRNVRKISVKMCLKWTEWSHQRQKAKETELREYMSKKFDIQPEDRIFENVTVSQLQRDITWAIQQAGVPKICIHGMRHSAASVMISQYDNMTYTDIADTLGHKSAKTTTTTYSHILPTTKTKLAQYIDNLHQDK